MGSCAMSAQFKATESADRNRLVLEFYSVNGAREFQTELDASAVANLIEVLSKSAANLTFDGKDLKSVEDVLGGKGA